MTLLAPINNFFFWDITAMLSFLRAGENRSPSGGNEWSKANFCHLIPNQSNLHKWDHKILNLLWISYLQIDVTIVINTIQEWTTINLIEPNRSTLTTFDVADVDYRLKNLLQHFDINDSKTFLK